MEVAYGIAVRGEREAKLASVMRAFFAAIATLPFDETDARAAAAVGTALKTKAQPIGAHDILVAGTALARGLVVVTSNATELARIGGLLVEDWRYPAPDSV
jgi:tRNA(fMet)-specific endonuclease VapC